jgi:hypothetical protein
MNPNSAIVIALPSPRAAASRRLHSTSSNTTSSRPRNEASPRETPSARGMPDSSVIARASSVRAAAAARSPAHRWNAANELSALGMTVSAPVSRANSTWRAASSCRVVVPEVDREPERPNISARGRALASKGRRRPLQQGSRRHIALGEPHHQTIEEHVGGLRRRGRRRRGTRCLGHLGQAVLTAESADGDRGKERLQVRVAREARVDRLELPGRPEEQRRGVTAPPQSERDLSAQPPAPGTPLRRPILRAPAHAPRIVRARRPRPRRARPSPGPDARRRRRNKFRD